MIIALNIIMNPLNEKQSEILLDNLVDTLRFLIELVSCQQKQCCVCDIFRIKFQL